MSSWRRLRGPLTLAVLYAIMLDLWLRARPSEVWFGSASASLGSIALAFGLVGMTAFAANLILGARLYPVQLWFGGLENLYRAHRGNGRLAYVLVALHVAGIVASRWVLSPEAALDLFTPSAGKVVLLGIAAFVAMSAAIAVTLYARLTHEVFVYVQRSFGIVFGLAALHVFMTAGAKASSRSLTIFLAVLSLTAVLAFAYRSLLGDLLVRRFEYVVTAARELDPAVVEITMAPVDERIRPLPGQFVYATFYSDEFLSQFHPVSVRSAGESATIVLRPGDVRNQFHPFSLTSAPEDAEIKLAVKAVGGFTKALHRLRPGATARIEGPYGEFSHLNMERTVQTWVAGGIGITPFLSMARSLGADNAYNVRLWYGVKKRSEAYFWDELEAISARVPGFAASLIAEDESGFITAEMLLGERDSDAADILICGPPAMVESLTTQLGAAGVPQDRIHGERFGFGPRT
jgi:predicted ferric reductase